MEHATAEKNGRRVGDTDRWSFDSLREATPEAVREISAKNARRFLLHMPADGLDDDAVIELAALVKDRIKSAKAKAANGK